MSRYKKYLQEIEERKTKGLQPKPIDAAELLNEIIYQIKDKEHEHRLNSIYFFIYNVNSFIGLSTYLQFKNFYFN